MRTNSGLCACEFGKYPGGSGGIAASCQRCPQTRRMGAAVVFVGLLGKHQTLGRVHEPPVEAAAGQPGVAGLVAEQCDGQRVHREGVDQVAVHHGRGVVQAVQDPQQRRADMFRRLEAGRGVVPDEDEQMVAFVQGQPQRPGQSRGDLD